MKIVHLCFDYVDGFSYQNNELPAAHARIGHKVTILSTQDFASALYYTPDLGNNMKSNKAYYIDNCKIIRLPLLYKSNYRIAINKQIYKYIEKENPNIIFYHNTPILNLISVRKYVKRHPECKLFIDFHSSYLNSSRNFISDMLIHRIFYKSILKYANKYIGYYYGITPGTIRFMIDKYAIDQNKIKLLPLGGSLSKININEREKVFLRIRDQLKISKDAVVIVFAGKIDKIKRVGDLIEAVNQIETNMDVKLLIIGSIEDVELKDELYKIADKNKRTIFLGWKTPEEIIDYYLSSDIACFPGGESVLWQQAICAGLPLVCRYNESGCEYIDKGNCIFLYSGTVNEVKLKLETLVNNPAEREKLSQAALDKGRPYFSYERIAQSIIEDYNKLSNSNVSKIA